MNLHVLVRRKLFWKYGCEHDNSKPGRAKWMKFGMLSLHQNCRLLSNVGRNSYVGSLSVRPCAFEHDNSKPGRARWMKFGMLSLHQNCRLLTNVGRNPHVVSLSVRPCAFEHGSSKTQADEI
ncbi:hypothetical protein AVEN_124666-1 [Araneus ventricosus]|uniref:Uncharacterized protein n=1 Tax=Araneus ventricosus TaxID=182803 RepID=A0A4Y2X3W3_ARAVE|nr:hypothetical protein AVEN_50777-1 [Araneus ventricosus]GBO42702.1 hypothetical protein AVEN_124666-1 [Araneus ventricosus]